MDLTTLKSHLDILQVAQNLGITINIRSQKALCPFHNDKTPSLQFSRDKQIATCFSSNCAAGTMDVINLVEKYKRISTGEAIKYLQNYAGGSSVKGKPKELRSVNNDHEESRPDYAAVFESMQSSLISSTIGRRYLESRHLNYKKLGSSGIGYNAFKNSRFPYLRGCVTFGLRDRDNKVVSLYGRSVRKSRASTGDKKNDASKHYYTTDRQGLYPRYPKPETKKLIITESIIDAASLLQLREITKEYEILSLYGTNGFMPDHIEAIKELKHLKEVIIWFDGDEAGDKGIFGYTDEDGNHKPGVGEKLKLIRPVSIRYVETPRGEDINSLLESHSLPRIGGEPQIIFHLIQEAKPFYFQEKAQETSVPVAQKRHEKSDENPNENKKSLKDISIKSEKLNIANSNNIKYQTDLANYYIKGGMRKDLDSLKVTLVIEPTTDQNGGYKKRSRVKLDLYEDKQTEKVSREAGEKLNLRSDLIERDINRLTDLLDEYRESISKKTKEKSTNKTQAKALSVTEKSDYIRFGKQSNLMEAINRLIGQSGIVGEEKSRLFLFVGAVSHLMAKPLHIVVQGGSGSGKSFIIRQVSYLVPQEKVKRYTRLSEKSFYNFGEFDLCNTLIIIEDYDGMNEEVEYAFRELQSNGQLISAVSGKEHEHSEIQTKDKIVRGPIASMVATTRGEIYHDNSTRVFFIAIDESEEQTQKIIDYKNKKANGEIKSLEEEKAKNYLQNYVRTLKNYRVKNPYLQYIKLPVAHDQLRRLHELLSSFCDQITLIHQHQRQKTKTGELIAEKKDMEIAIDLMFDSIILKVDELDGSLRLFYERLKKYVLKKGKAYNYTRREVRQSLKISKSQIQRYMYELESLEYIERKGRGGYGSMKYKIVYWDDNEALRQGIKSNLWSQLSKL